MYFINSINTTINSKYINPEGGRMELTFVLNQLCAGYCLGKQCRLIFRGWTLVFILYFPSSDSNESCWEAEPASQFEAATLTAQVKHLLQFQATTCARPWSLNRKQWETGKTMIVLLPDQPCAWLFSCCSFCTIFRPGSPSHQVILSIK